ncbi:unnamed protein product [Pedinophyceae sp. YPF-701]|nr:unnamed protein product [Pedinophyceae sp. YPF-701]
MALKVAVIGAGGVGRTLGARLLLSPSKFSVKYGVRSTEARKTRDLLAEQQGSSAATVHEAIQWSDAAIVALPGAHDDADMAALVETLGPCDGKVILDATNPLSPFQDGLKVRWGRDSGGEALAKAVPEAHVVKCFNTIGMEHMADPVQNQTGQPMTMMYAGAPEAREVTERIVEGVGFRPRYCGPIYYARHLEAMAELWIHASLGVGEFPPDAAWGRNWSFEVSEGSCGGD